MRRMPLAGAALLLCAAAQAALPRGAVVQARHDDAVGCTDGTMLLTLEQQRPGLRGSPGWRDRITALGCYPVAADQQWTVEATQTGLFQGRLVGPATPTFSLWFAARDFRPADTP